MESMQQLLWLCPCHQITHKDDRKMFLYHPPDVTNSCTETLLPCPQSSDHISTSLLHTIQGEHHTLSLCTEITLITVQNCPDLPAAIRYLLRISSRWHYLPWTSPSAPTGPPATRKSTIITARTASCSRHGDNPGPRSACANWGIAVEDPMACISSTAMHAMRGGPARNLFSWRGRW